MSAPDKAALENLRGPFSSHPHAPRAPRPPPKPASHLETSRQPEDTAAKGDGRRRMFGPWKPLALQPLVSLVEAEFAKVLGSQLLLCLLAAARQLRCSCLIPPRGFVQKIIAYKT